MTGDQQALVSVVIPTLNSETFIRKCLTSVKNQTYPHVEIIVVDGFSKDRTVEFARQYTSKVYLHGPKQSREAVFGAPYQRNFGAAESEGQFVYYVDADMELTEKVISSAVRTIDESGADAVIIPEISMGRGFWSECKSMERRCYIGDDLAEAPRFFKREVWEKLNGLDPQVGADDWDLYHRLKRRGFKATRTAHFVIHNEGNLTLRKLALKRYTYGKHVHKFLQRYGGLGFKQLFPIKANYIRNWRLFAHDPTHAFGVVLMRVVEYIAGTFGLIIGKLTPAAITPRKSNVPLDRVDQWNSRGQSDE